MDFHDFAKRNGMQITAVKQVFRGPDGRRYERLADGSRVPLSGTARDGEVLMFFDGVPDDATGSQPPAGPAVRDSVPAGTFVDAYGRTLATGATSGNDRADGKALGARLAYERDLANAWRQSDPELPERSPVAFSSKRREA